MLDSTLLISDGPKPVAVRLCLGLVNSGPTGPLSSEMGALVEGLLSRVVVVEVAMVEYIEPKGRWQALRQRWQLETQRMLSCWLRPSFCADRGQSRKSYLIDKNAAGGGCVRGGAKPPPACPCAMPSRGTVYSTLKQKRPGWIQIQQ